MRDPLEIRILSKIDSEKKVGWLMNEIPQFTKILIDDISECVYVKYKEKGAPVIGVFPYERTVYFT